MAYTLKIRIVNDTEDEIHVIDKASRASAARWGQMAHGYMLNMNSSGHAGVLIFENTWGEKFALATGVHNYKRWVDISTSVGDQNATQVLDKYFTSNTTEDGNKWKVWSTVNGKLSGGKQLNAFFYVDEGNDLRADFVYH